MISPPNEMQQKIRFYYKKVVFVALSSVYRRNREIAMLKKRVKSRKNRNWKIYYQLSQKNLLYFLSFYVVILPI
ncbi:MAG TPA: hypothetical protein DEP42_06375 [Ruminococcaceae bacterium]|nr:hypothetical protein [Oscillospiraceae bacterium]